MNLLKINGCYDHRVDDMDIGYNNEVTNEFEGYLACAENNYLIGTINSKKNKEKKLLVIGKFVDNITMQLYFIATNHIIFNQVKYDFNIKKFIGTWKNINCSKNIANSLEISLSGMHKNSLETQLTSEINEKINNTSKEHLIKVLNKLSK
mgnify:CR=1 FL=1